MVEPARSAGNYSSAGRLERHSAQEYQATLRGYPLIAYSIAAGLQSQWVTRVIVSTDDEEIAETARQHGAEVPFLRPSEFAQDKIIGFARVSACVEVARGE